MDELRNPDALDGVRRDVREWLVQAAISVQKFLRPDGRFCKDSDRFISHGGHSKYEGFTTTCRAYMSLISAHRRCIPYERSRIGTWVYKGFSDFIEHLEVPSDINVFSENEQLTSLGALHIADLFVVADYLERFVNKGVKWDTRPQLQAYCHDRIAELLESVSSGVASGVGSRRIGASSAYDGGRLAIMSSRRDDGMWYGHHFVVTLQLLRACSIACPDRDKCVVTSGIFETLAADARQFCVEQCFYAQNGVAHRRDVLNHVFATCIYVMLSHHVETDLAVACIRSIAEGQYESGRWPANFPLILEGGTAWHVSSHDIALALTWLYVQPKLPDESRPVLVACLERYFRKWIVPTFNHRLSVAHDGVGRDFKGWNDDHSMADDIVVGWATAIVCHFLANFNGVLNFEINCAVIESLELKANAYRLSRRSSKKIDRWADAVTGGKDPVTHERVYVLWPDLPPMAWRNDDVDESELRARLAQSWRDPSPDMVYSRSLVHKVIAPILRDPAGRALSCKQAGMLHGPPGTGKSTLVNQLATALDWARVEVPASTLIAEGWDKMEATSQRVFRWLGYLTRCVIFFDEFDEFFRRRPEGATDSRSALDNRTVAAFTTAAMLPRLQELHNECRCLIIVATNRYEDIDDAVRRVGRFDYSLFLGYPTFGRLAQYVEQPTGKLHSWCEGRDMKPVFDLIGLLKENLGRDDFQSKGVQFEEFERAVVELIQPGAPSIESVAKNLVSRMAQKKDLNVPDNQEGDHILKCITNC